ncbi:P-loop containing nucleoside triphosphate hydrolase protein [Mycena olivaceomarginata]|nr:P-loop containing nucleoside triphosphate hydrolase protein [Mycena olivaceomarginata]
MDVLCQAKSGHGKTGGFRPHHTPAAGARQWRGVCPRSCHTRELAFQIKNEYSRFAKYMPDVRVSTFYGGTPVAKDSETLREKTRCPHIVVATPGRLNALARDKHFVLDECDKMLEQLDMRRDVQEISGHPSPQTSDDVQHHAGKEIRGTSKKFVANETRKNRKLNELLDSLEFSQVVTLVKVVARANELDKLLVSVQLPSISIHSGLVQEEHISRYMAFKAFEKKRILVTTDTFGRGIDVERVNIVINYDCRPNTDSYLHRVGRVGSIRDQGLAVMFVVSETDQQVMTMIQLRFTVAVPELPDQH